MLNNLVIHLKNIIFFKLVIYALLVLGLLLLAPVFKENLAKSVAQKEKAIAILDNVKHKLTLITESSDQVEETITQYDLLITDKIDLGCKKTTQFIKQLMNLNTQYKLLAPITYSLSNNYDYKESITSHNITIECNIIDIEFTVSNQNQFILVQKNIYDILPAGSVILEEHIETLDTITPSMIEQLERNYSPNLLRIKIKLMLRNAKYKK